MADNAKLVIEIADGSRGGSRDPNLPPPLPPQALAPVGVGGGGGGSAGAGTALQPAGRSPGPGVSTVPAFDRPVPVIIVGPKSLLDGLESKQKPQQPGQSHQENWRRHRRNWTETWQQAGWAAQRAGMIGVGIARNETGPALAGALDAATTGLSRLGPYGMAAGAALQAVGSAARAASQTVNAFVERGRELARFDPRLAAAAGMADVKRIQADIREAQQLGAGMARMIEKQAELEVAVRELVLPIKEFVVEVFADVMGIVADAARFLLGRGKEAKPEKLNAIMADFLGMIDDRIGTVGAGVMNKFNDNPDRAAAAKLGIPILDI